MPKGPNCACGSSISWVGRRLSSISVSGEAVDDHAAAPERQRLRHTNGMGKEM